MPSEIKCMFCGKEVDPVEQICNCFGTRTVEHYEMQLAVYRSDRKHALDLLTGLEKILAASPVMYWQAKDSCGRNGGEPKGTITAQIPWEMLERIREVLGTVSAGTMPVATGLET